MSDYFDRVERQIVRRVEAGAPHGSRFRLGAGHLAVAAAVLVVIAVAGVFLLARSGGSGNQAPAAHPAVRIVLTAPPGSGPGAIEHSAQILRARLAAAAVPEAAVSVAGEQVVVTAARAGAGLRSEILTLVGPGRLGFYDWEADVMAPDGKTVASQLPSPDASVLDISQGNGSSAPGQLGAGCLPLAQALALADRLGAGRPRRTEYIGALRLRVPVGYVVIEAAGSPFGRPTDGYYVLRALPTVGQDMITNPRQSTDPNTGARDVVFDFTASGRRYFAAVTATIARRGAAVSSLGNTLNQHFAIAVDNQLITVPYVDYKQYPDGISGNDGADITANFTKRSAQDLAILLRYGPLPVPLTATG